MLPYTRIEGLASYGANSPDWVLVGASGSRLFAQSSSGATSVWPLTSRPTRNVSEDESQEPPGKKIKLSSVEKISNFSLLAVTHDHKHFVAVTAEDKCIRVFELDANFQIQQLSQRCMARRPSAITLTTDDSTILCADKFGDVYALPLIPPPDDEQNGTPFGEHSEIPAKKQYAPAATVLTVHSGRNRKVLEEQMKQAAQGHAKTKEPMKFKHDLLLGHVSMLTDIVHATVPAPTEGVKPRSYILTADRDEHIRVSRGIPQAHIIEGFCHGHDEFISRLCMTKSEVLVSGGGDSHLFVWDWPNYRLLTTLNIQDAFSEASRNASESTSTVTLNRDEFRVAVSGIWSVPRRHSDGEDILVACEGVPVLVRCRVTGPDSFTLEQTTSLEGNVVDVTFLQTSSSACTAVVSVDNLHKPGSTTEIRGAESTVRLQCLSVKEDGSLEQDVDLEAKLEWFRHADSVPKDKTEHEEGTFPDADSKGGILARARSGTDEKAVRDMLYGVENLRKRPGAED